MLVDGQVNITETGKWGNTSFNSSVDEALRQMDEAEITKGVLLPLNGFATNKYIASEVKNHQDRFIGFGNVGKNNWKDGVNEVLDLGLEGIKFHPRIEGQTPKEWLDKGIFESLEKNKLPVKICGWLQSSSVPIEELTPLKIDVIAKAHPQLKIILSHLGGHYYWDAFFVARSNKNVFLDCSYFLKVFEGTSLENDFFTSMHLIDQKVIFGSDFPEVNINDYKLKVLRGLSLNRKTDGKNIFSNNFIQILNEAKG